MARPVTSAALLLAALLGLATCTPAAAQSSDYHDCSCKCCDGEGCANDDWHVTTFFAGGRDKCSANACRSAVAQCKDVGSHYDTQVYATFLDCECSCCTEDTCPEMASYLFPAGSRDRCTAAQCSSRFRNCLDPGSHNLPNSVFAKYFDCACECCDDAESCEADDFFINRFYAGSELSCTPNACRANNNKCMDVGSHNNGAEVNAIYSGADVGTLDHSCECSCCMGEAGCASGLIDYTYFADHPAACNEAQCSANFATCPDAGSHNKDAQVFATFYNCKCECCQGNNCPDFVSNVFLASSSDQCTAQHCSSRFASCPDVGSHNSDGQVRAIYNRAISTTGVASPTTTSSSDGGPLPPGAVFGIIAVAAVAVLVLVGGAIYIIRKKRQGYKWMSEDHMTNLAFDGNTNKGTEMTDSAMGGNSPDGEKVVENA